MRRGRGSGQGPESEGLVVNQEERTHRPGTGVLGWEMEMENQVRV